MEQWKHLSNWPEYEVSTAGYIRRNGRLLTASPSARHRRLQIRLAKPEETKHVMLARLVYETFKGPLGDRIIRYRDNNPRNCALENLYAHGSSSRGRSFAPPIFDEHHLWTSLFREVGGEYCVALLAISPAKEAQRLERLEQQIQQLLAQESVDITPSAGWSFTEQPLALLEAP